MSSKIDLSVAALHLITTKYCDKNINLLAEENISGGYNTFPTGD